LRSGYAGIGVIHPEGMSDNSPAIYRRIEDESIESAANYCLAARDLVLILLHDLVLD